MADSPTAQPSRAADGTAYHRYGPQDGAAVVLIHGLGLSQRVWDDALQSFVQRFRTITYDLYGHGHSGPVPADLQPLSLRGYATQLARLLDELHVETAHIVGFSIGGMINRRFALDHPERTASLVIVSSPHDRGPDGQDAVEARAAAVRNQGAMATMDTALIRWFTPGHVAAHPEHEDLVRAWRLQADPESYAQATWVLANGVRELVDPTPPIAHPTLVLTGENDSGSTPAMSHAIAAEIDGAETLVIGRYQHLGLMEEPAAFVDPIIDFLERTVHD